MPKTLSPEQQQSIAKQAISTDNISHIAQRHRVSRNTVYHQRQRALSAIDDEFLSSTPDEKVLFYLPVTKDFLHQMVVALLMICKASYRDCQLFLRDIFDTHLALGTVWNIHESVCQKAIDKNGPYSLSGIQQSQSDEIYHRNKPHLAVVDTRSRYCASLSKEEQCDHETWAIHLLDLIGQGFQPNVNITDRGPGMTKALKDILPQVDHRFDHFHLIKAGKELVRLIKNRKESAVTHLINIMTKMDKAKLKKQGRRLSSKLHQAGNHAEQLDNTSDSFKWMRTARKHR